MDVIQKIRYKGSIWYYRYWKARHFARFDKSAIVYCPLNINGMEHISLGANVQINYRTWLAALPLTNMPSCDLVIGAGTIIGNFNHIYATHKVVLGKKVLTADKVYISDNLHDYRNIDLAIMDQPVIQNKEVSIGDGTWIGENAVILGCSIGRNCVVAANAVVTKDVPDYSIVGGVPAKVLKRFNVEKQQWISVI